MRTRISQAELANLRTLSARGHPLSAGQKNILLEHANINRDIARAQSERSMDERLRRELYGDNYDRLTPEEDTFVSESVSRDLRESVGMGSFYDPDANLGASAGGTQFMRRLSAHAERKDLPPFQHERMLKIAAYMWDRNPLAARVIKRAINYVLGEGMKVVAHHEDEALQKKIQEVIDNFWNDPFNDMQTRLRGWCIAWRAYGELILHTAVNEHDGSVRLAYVSPEIVLKVLPKKEDIERPDFLRVRMRDGDAEGKKVQVVQPIEDTERPLGSPIRMDGEYFYWAANTLPDMVRGRSDLYAIADILDAYDQFIWNRLERQAMLLAFVWSVELQGATEPEIKEWVKANGGTPRPGSMQVHNDKVKWNALTPSLGSGEASTESDLLLNHIATSQGMPAMWFGEENDPNRANGENLTGPTLKDLTALQKEFGTVVKAIITFVLDCAVRKGKLPKDLDSARAFKVTFPDLSIRDMASMAATLGTMAASLETARTSQLIDLETSQELFVLTLAPAGLEIDINAMREKIKAEKAERDAQFEQQMLDAEKQQPQNGQETGQEGGKGGGKPPPGKKMSLPPVRGPSKAGADGSERRRE